MVGAGARLRVHPEILQNTAAESTYRTAVMAIIEFAFSPQVAPRLVELATKRMMETRPSVLHGDFLACDAFDEMERVAEIHQPALVICGSDDNLTPVRYSKFLADKIPDSRLEIIPDAGHIVMLEQPQVVADTLVTFLDEILF